MGNVADSAAPVQGASQQVRAYGGYAVAVQGADVHLYENRGLVYEIADLEAPATPDDRYLLAQPSRMLNAQYQVVEFTGRERELAGLARWRDGDTARLSVCWMLGPGGQGKSRLAAQFAALSAVAGWKAVTVRHGRGELLPPIGSQDLRLGDHAGVLAVVDYAERWPVSLLTLLMSNALFHRHVPARLLLLARSASSWQALRSALEGRGIEATSMVLPPLTEDRHGDDRRLMFNAARDAIARRFGIRECTQIRPPGPLTAPEYGLPLTVQMAALAAVDAFAQGAKPPSSPTALSPYLLRREMRHWHSLYENRLEGLDFETPPSDMARVVFAAVLTGATDYNHGLSVMGRLGARDSGRLLADHAVCYPPSDPGTVLEPLYPDRLAEDFLALSLPGHMHEDFPASPWASATAARLAAREDREPPGYAGRLVQFLAAASGPGRWPHAAGHLAAILRADPSLAVCAGSAALHAIAEVPDIEIAVLETIEECLPAGSDVDLDPGIAAIAERVTAHRLAHTTDLATRAGLLASLQPRQSRAGLHVRAATTIEQAIVIYRGLSDADPSAYQGELAGMLNAYSNVLMSTGKYQEAVTAAREAVRLYRGIAAYDRAAVHTLHLAAALTTEAVTLSRAGHQENALTSIEEAWTVHQSLRDEMRLDNPAADDLRSEYLSLFPAVVRVRANIPRWAGRSGDDAAALEHITGLYRSMVEEHHDNSFLPDLAGTLTDLSYALSASEHQQRALAAISEAVTVYRRLAEANPTAYRPRLARAVGTFGSLLGIVGRAEEAQQTLEEAADLYRQLALINLTVGLPGLINVLGNQAHLLSTLGRNHEAWAACREALDSVRQLTQATDPEDRPVLASIIELMAERLAEQEQHDEALATAREAEALTRELAARSPTAHRPSLARALDLLGNELMHSGDVEQALETGEEAIALWRQLIAVDPAEHEPGLAKALANRGYRQCAASRMSEAAVSTRESAAMVLGLPASQEAAVPVLLPLLKVIGASLYEADDVEDSALALRTAVEIGRSRAARLTEELQGIFASSLDALSLAETRLGNTQAALAASIEAVAVFRSLAAASSGSRAEDFAVALNHLGTALANGQQLTEALAVHREAVAEFRRIAQARPLEKPGALVDALSNLAGLMFQHGQAQDAVNTIENACEIARQLVQVDPSANLPELARALRNCVIACSGSGATDRAHVIARESVAVNRRLCRLSPPPRTAELDLAVALGQLSEQAHAAGNLSEALESAEEGLTLLRRVERDSPSLLSWHGPVILRSYASALFSLSADHYSAGRIQQAIETTRRAAAHYAAVGDQHSEALLLDNLCIYLTQVGQEPEAIEAGRQAVALFAQTGDTQLEASAQANLEEAIRRQRSIRLRRWTRGH